MRPLIILLMLAFFTPIKAQILNVAPTFPTVDDDVTIIYDATKGNGALVGVSQIYAHTGVILAGGDPTEWEHVQGTWGTPDPLVEMTNLGNDKHQITYNINDFYGISQGEVVEKMAFVFRDVSGGLVGREADGADIFYDVASANSPLAVSILTPDDLQIVNANDVLHVEAESSVSGTLTLYDNGNLIATAMDSVLIHDITVAGSGNHTVVVFAENNTESAADSFHYVINPNLPPQDPPSGSRDGITYLSPTAVRLQLYAPGKNHIYAIGDFNDYKASVDYYLRKSLDGNTFWIDITGLTAGQDYTFQYLVDGNLKIADPYSSLILDPGNDGFITAATYPDLPTYPEGLTTGIVTVIQPGKTPYSWQSGPFQKPAETDLVVYELLLRDFLASHDYKTLKDTLDYLDNLGINAIQLMPVNEFEGNLSWGYNPSFHQALDKYYGSADDFKAFVDECHNRGIAVLLDVVFNHAFSQSPLCRLYWDEANFRPTADNPWLNEFPTHGFNVGYDFNHESAAFRRFMDQVLAFWVSEYRVDGFRFDLSKGFTQTQTCDPTGGNCNIGNWSNYDASRIASIKRMADAIWANDATSLLILEHFADNDEEKELADYGLMLWGAGNCNYNQASMGYGTGPCDWDFNWASNYQQRGWNDPHLVSFMESHDEERLMYKNLEFGNSNGNYDIQNLATALERQELVSTFFYTIPGPRQLWQFGELGYDYSINTCSNGTIDPDCRLDSKPIRWDYFQQSTRQKLYYVTRELLDLRRTYPTFQTSNYDLSTSGNTKRIRLNHSDMDAIVLGNFDVVSADVIPAFQNTGWWYEYFTGDSISVTGVNTPLTLSAGEYRIYTSKRIPAAEIPVMVGTTEIPSVLNDFSLYPNPANDLLFIEWQQTGAGGISIALFDQLGRLVKDTASERFSVGKQAIELDVSDLPRGIYFVQLEMGEGSVCLKFAK